MVVVLPVTAKTDDQREVLEEYSPLIQNSAGSDSLEPGLTIAGEEKDSDDENALSISVESLTQQEFATHINSLSLSQLNEWYLATYHANEFDKAAQFSEELIRRIEREHGAESILLVGAMNKFAQAQQQLGSYESTEKSYRRSINIIELHEGQYSPRLIQPLSGLGLAYESLERNKEAIDIYRRAQHVIHRKEGVFSIEQLGLLNRMTINFGVLRDFEEADRAQRLRFKVSKHNSHNQADILAAQHELSDWYANSGQYFRAIKSYKNSIRQIEEMYGKNDIRLLRPLRGIVHAGRGVESVEIQGISTLRRTEKILAKNPDVAPLEHASTLIAQADFYTVTDKTLLAEKKYRDAWQILQTDKDKQAFFSMPVRVSYPRLFVRRGVVGRRYQGTYIYDLEFDVMPDGRVSNVKFDNDDRPEILNDIVVEEIEQNLRYRPRYKDGIAVATEGVMLKQKIIVTNLE